MRQVLLLPTVRHENDAPAGPGMPVLFLASLGGIRRGCGFWATMGGPQAVVCTSLG
jgi:hypothetical protein